MADIVIAPFTVNKKCRAARVIVDRRMLREGGAHALYIDGLSIRDVSVASERGHRPWVPEHVLVRGAPQLEPNESGDDNETDNVGRHSGNPEE